MNDRVAMMEECNERLEAERLRNAALSAVVQRLSQEKRDLQAENFYLRQSKCEG